MEVEIKNKKPDVRHLNDMKKVIYDKEWLKTAGNPELYYMYRGLKEPRTKAFGLVRSKENDLKYNITVLPARMLGKEFVKTKGHVHIGNYGETYTVLEGEAIYLMQKTKPFTFFNKVKGKDEIIEDVYAVKAKKGESIIIPPGYGHVTINPSGVDLKTGDWSSKNCKSDYSLFEKLQGACYYYILRPGASTELSRMSSGQAIWVKNENYKKVPPLRFEEPLKSLPKDLSFLKGN